MLSQQLASANVSSRKPSNTWQYITTDAQLRYAADFLAEYITWEDHKLACDTETFCPAAGRETLKRVRPKKQIPLAVWAGRFMLGWPRLITFGTDPIWAPPDFKDKQLIIDTASVSRALFTERLTPILTKAVVLGHNFKYDWQHLFMYSGIKIPRNKLLDTMLFNQILKAGCKGIGHGLDDCYAQEIHPDLFYELAGCDHDAYVQFKKTYQAFPWDTPILPVDGLQYAADDCRFIFFVYDKLHDKLATRVHEVEKQPEGRSLADVCKLEMQIIPAVAMMEMRGAPFSKERHRELLPILEAAKQDEVEILEGYPEFYVTPPRGVKQVRLAAEVGATKDSAELAAVLRKALAPKFKGLTYEVTSLDSLPKLKVVQVLTERSDAGDGVVVQWRSIPGAPSYEDVLGIAQPLAADYEHVYLERQLIDVESPAQVKEALVRLTGRPVEKTDKEVLKHLATEFPEVADALLEYRALTKLSGTYGAPLISFCTEAGKIHSSINQMGQDSDGISTGRMSSSNPNCQNIPAHKFVLARYYGDGKGISSAQLIRGSFLAPPGYVHIIADLSQIEPRIAAWVTRDPAYLGAIQRGEDLHGLTGQACLDLDYIPPKGSFERDKIGKQVHLSTLYGIGGYALSEFLFVQSNIVRDARTCKGYTTKFLKRFPGIKRKMDEIAHELASRPCAAGSLAPWKGRKVFGEAVAACGRIRNFTLTKEQERMPDIMLTAGYGKDSEDSWYRNPFEERLQDAALKGFNFLIQGHAATVMKRCLLLTEQAIAPYLKDPLTEGIWNIVHDELDILVREDVAEEVAKVVKAAMEAGGDHYLAPVVRCKADVTIAKTWAEK